MSPLDPRARLGAARIFWYATGRFYVGADGTLQDAGYFVRLGELGTGWLGAAGAAARPEGAAQLTFLAAPWRSTAVDNGDLSLSLAPPGDFTVFYHPAGGADFADPTSFARGQAIATFRRDGQVVTTTIASGRTRLVGINVFTAELIASEPFTHAGVRHDLGALVPDGVTQWGVAGEDPLPDPPAGIVAVVPFVGSAVAAGPRG